ncbi:hypothetical protein FJTKL_09045 [Diaporthe vaccinii]|uniref:RING-type domain-containing protein n=1 Tax=Diaporthe vaccinii TaxID=105482 RepID=A0ABR4EPJ1_9PEZI
MPGQEETTSPGEIIGKHASQTHIHTPQPINSAALQRLQAVLELYDIIRDDGSIAAGDVTPQVGTASLDLGSGILTTTNSDTPSDGAVKSHDLSESPPFDYPDATSEYNANVELQEDETDTPEQVTFWPILERYLNDPSLPCPELICPVCFDVMVVLGLDQDVREDLSSDYERCIVLLCGHLIGNRCLDEHVSKHLDSEDNKYWQDGEQEFWFMPTPCPTCRTRVGCRRCGQSYESACLPASIEDEWVDVSLVLTGPVEPQEFCEDCSIYLEE